MRAKGNGTSQNRDSKEVDSALFTVGTFGNQNMLHIPSNSHDEQLARNGSYDLPNNMMPRDVGVSFGAPNKLMTSQGSAMDRESVEYKKAKKMMLSSID